MVQAIGYSSRGIRFAIGTIERLKQEVIEGKMLEFLGIHPLLRKHQFQLATVGLNQCCRPFGTHGDPIDFAGNSKRAVRLNGNLEFEFVDCRKEAAINLKERLSAG